MMETISEPLEEHHQPSFSGAVDVVALAAAIAGDRGDHRDGAVPLRLEPVGDEGQKRRGRGEIHFQGPDGVRRTLLTASLVRQGPVRDEGDIDSARRERPLYDRGMTLGREHIERRGLHLTRSPDHQVVGDCSQSLWIPAGQDDSGAAFRESPRHLGGDRGCGSHD
jgi:hypothetical protein